jgi:hypothetical protein
MVYLLGLSSKLPSFGEMAQMYPDSLKEHCIPPQIHVPEIPRPNPISVAGSVGDLDILLMSIGIRRRRSPRTRGPVGVRMRRRAITVRRSARNASRLNPVIPLRNLTVSTRLHTLLVSLFSLPNLSGELRECMFSNSTYIHSFLVFRIY